MATDEALKDAETAGAGMIAGFARSVTRPGGMNMNWVKVRAGGAVIAGIALLHGVKGRKWRYIHTLGVVIGVAAATATILQNKYTERSATSAGSAGLDRVSH
jgi:hypothetical protein